jgi:uncharacterized protein (DUF433 family)
MESVSIDELINIDPEIMAGTPVFRGTRVPIHSLFEYMENGYSLDEFLDTFPTVRRDQVIALLQLSETSALEKAAV